MKKILVYVLTLLSASAAILAQSEARQPVLIDEFGILNQEDNFARLDGLAYQLSKSDDSKAVIRINGGGETCFLCHYRQGSYTTAILKSRQHPLDKISIEYCQGSENLRVQFYLIPPGLTLSPCDQTLIAPKTTVLFETIYFNSETRIKPFEGVYVASTSPAEGEYSLKGLQALKEILSKAPESRIYMTVYLGTNPVGYPDGKTLRKPDKKSLASKMLLNAKNEFIKNGIAASQIKTLDGGYTDSTRKLELRFVPAGGAIPTPEPDYVPKRRK